MLTSKIIPQKLYGGGGSSKEERGIKTLESASIFVNGNLLRDSRAEDVRDFTGSRSIISSSVLQQSGFNTLEQSLQSIPSIQIRETTPTGSQPEIKVRGMPSGRAQETEVFLDGIPIAPAPYGNLALSGFPITYAMIDRIDIVRGGAAIQYGPTNVGGIINFISKDIPNTYQSQASFKTTSYLYNNFLFDTYLRTGGMLNKFFGFQAEGNFVKGSGYRQHSNTQLQNYSLKIITHLGELGRIQAGYYYFDASIDLPSGILPETYELNPYFSDAHYDENLTTSQRAYFIYNQKFEKFSFIDASEFNLASYFNYMLRDIRYIAHKTGKELDPKQIKLHRQELEGFPTSPRTFYVFGINPRLTFYSNFSSFLNNTFLLGSQYTFEKINIKSTKFGILDNAPFFSKILTSSAKEYMTNALAIYISDELNFFDFISLTPAIRYEYIKQDYIGKENSKIDAFLPSISVGITPIQEIFIYYNSQRSIRPPQFGIQFLDGKNTILKSPEVAWNHEIGIRYFPTPSTMLSLGYFYIDYKGKSVWDTSKGLSGEFSYGTNYQSQGIEFEGYYSPFRELKLNFGYSYTNSIINNGIYKGNKTPNISPHHISFGGFYQLNDFYLGLTTFWYSQSFSDNANTKKENELGFTGIVPAYWSSNLSLGYDFKFKNQTINAQLSINNIFDNKYYYRSIYSMSRFYGREPASSRSVGLKIGYKF